MSRILFDGVDYVLTFSDSVIVADATAKTIGKVFSNAVVVADATTKTQGKVFSNSVVVADSLTKTQSKVFSDTARATDSVAKLQGKVFSNAVIVAEAVAKTLGKVFSDTALVADATAKTQGKAFSNGVIGADSIAKAQGKVFSDSITAADAEAYAHAGSFTETITTTDGVTFAVGLAFSDGIIAGDIAVLGQGKVFADSVVVADAAVITRIINRAFADAVVVSDSADVQKVKLLFLSPKSQTGFLEGGEPFIIYDGLLNTMTLVEDDFSDGAIGALWSTANAGTGTVVEVGSAASLVLDTGTTAASIARLRSTFDEKDFDVQARFAPSLAPQGSLVEGSAILGFYVASTTYVRLRASLVAGVVTIYCEGQVAGASSFLGTLPLATVALSTLGGFNLRLLRAGSRIHALFNDAVVASFPWTDADGVVELAAENAAAGTRMVVGVSNYVRRPVILFRDAVVLNVERVDRRVYGTAPAGYEGAADITIGLPELVHEITAGWTYIPHPTLLQTFTGGGATVKILTRFTRS